MADEESCGGTSTEQVSSNAEHLIATTFDKLPADTKVLIALFSALNSASGLAQAFELPNHLWDTVRFGDGGPLVGQSEEVNWLKVVCDGILLVLDHV